MSRSVMLLIALAGASACFDSPLAAYLEEQRIQRTPQAIAWTRIRRTETAEHVRQAAARARQAGQTPILYVKASWCPACKLFERSLSEPEVVSGLADAHVIELDIDQHGPVMEALGQRVRAVPTFAHLDPTTYDMRGPTITSAAWGEDSPANIGAAMAAFVTRDPDAGAP